MNLNQNRVTLKTRLLILKICSCEISNCFLHFLDLSNSNVFEIRFRFISTSDLLSCNCYLSFCVVEKKTQKSSLGHEPAVLVLKISAVLVLLLDSLTAINQSINQFISPHE